MEKLIEKIGEITDRIGTLKHKIKWSTEFIKLTESEIRNIRYDAECRLDRNKYEKKLKEYCLAIVTELAVLDLYRKELEEQKIILNKLTYKLHHWYGDYYNIMDDADIVLKIERDGFIPGTKI